MFPLSKFSESSIFSDKENERWRTPRMATISCTTWSDITRSTTSSSNEAQQVSQKDVRKSSHSLMRFRFQLLLHLLLFFQLLSILFECSAFFRAFFLASALLSTVFFTVLASHGFFWSRKATETQFYSVFSSISTSPISNLHHFHLNLGVFETISECNRTSSFSFCVLWIGKRPDCFKTFIFQ